MSRWDMVSSVSVLPGFRDADARLILMSVLRSRVTTVALALTYPKDIGKLRRRMLVSRSWLKQVVFQVSMSSGIFRDQLPGRKVGLFEQHVSG